MHFETCPRCGLNGYEALEMHAYCINCNYSPDLEGGINKGEKALAWALREVGPDENLPFTGLCLVQH